MSSESVFSDFRGVFVLGAPHLIQVKTTTCICLLARGDDLAIRSSSMGSWYRCSWPETTV